MSEVRTIDTSYVGKFIYGTYAENGRTGVASASFMLGDGKTEKTIMGTGENEIEMLKRAFAEKDEIIVLGTIPEGKKDPAMNITGVGPLEIVGKVDFVRHCNTGQNDSVTAMVEITNDNGKKVIHVITGYGEYVKELDGMQNEDIIHVHARPSWEKIAATGEYQPILRMTAPGRFNPALENTVTEEEADNSPSP